MQKTEVYAELTTKINGITIITVVRIVSGCWHEGQAVSFSGMKQPVGVIVITPSDKKGFDMSSAEIPLERFINEVPELETILSNY